MSFARTGEAAAQNYLLTSEAVGKNSWDPNKLIKESIKGRSLQKQAAAQADAAKFESKQTSRIVEAKAKLAVDEFNAALDLDKSKRKAGIIATAGSFMAKNFQKTPDPIKPYQPSFAGYEGAIKQGEDALTRANQAVEKQKQWIADNFPNFSTSTVDPTSSTASTLNPITPTGGTVDRGEVYNYLTTDKGLSKNKALGLMANIDRESGFNASIASGDDGGPGGLFQWKGPRQTPTVAQLVKTGDWKGQIDYALTEPGEASSSTFLNTTWNSPQEAAAFWTRKWERPADPDKDVVKNNNFIAGYNF